MAPIKTLRFIPPERARIIRLGPLCQAVAKPPMSEAAVPFANNSAQDMREEFLRTGDAGAMLRRRAAEADLLVRQSFDLHLAGRQPGLSILAVGGYGRRELFPCSDIDLLLLFQNDRLAQSTKAAVGDFLQWLWDSGLRISQSVRTPEECIEYHDQNPELNISILDLRFLAGDEAQYAALTARLPRFLRGQRDALSRALIKLAHSRYEKFGNTLYHLEPNVKEAPGGLRDYQLICWLEQLRHGAAGSKPALPELDQARDYLFRLRSKLHLMVGRDSNLLTFDLQEMLAGQEGVSDAGWMRDYYRHARTVWRAAQLALENAAPEGNTMLGQFRDWRSRLSNADFSVSRERVYLRTPGRVESEPEFVWRVFEFVARHGIRLAPDTERRIASAVPAIERYFAQPRPVWPALAAILALPHAARALRAMHLGGVLSVVFPEFGEIECLVTRDFYHRYTVDEHSLVAIEGLEGLARRKNPADARYSELLSEIEKPAVLSFALLFHDVGKAGQGHGHVAGSAAAAARALERTGAPEAVRAEVVFLIERHLEMSAILQSRDPDEPATARMLAAQVGTVERLKALTLLTWADIGAVNPQALTAWRSDQLWRLYVNTYNTLTVALDTERIESPPAGSPERAAFLAGFPTRYLRTHPAGEIDAHFELAGRAAARGAAASIERLNGVYRLTVSAHDRPFLFASIAGTLSSFGMNILRAEAFANRRGTVLDTFTFADPSRTLDLNPTEVDRLQLALERAAMGRQDVRRLLQSRPKAVPPSRGARFQPRVAFDSEASPASTLVEILAEDRPGLLYDLAMAMSTQGCSIETVLIDTEAHRAIDVFYIQSEGRKLDASAREKLGRLLLEACAGAH
jgi:[protein-PII] uridylyltransferase